MDPCKACQACAIAVWRHSCWLLSRHTCACTPFIVATRLQPPPPVVRRAGAARPRGCGPTRPPALALLPQRGGCQLLPALAHGECAVGAWLLASGICCSWVPGETHVIAVLLAALQLTSLYAPVSLPWQTVTVCLYSPQTTPRLRQGGMEFAV